MTGDHVQRLQLATAAFSIHCQAEALTANGLISSRSSTVPTAQQQLDTCGGCMMGNMYTSCNSALRVLSLCLWLAGMLGYDVTAILKCFN